MRPGDIEPEKAERLVRGIYEELVLRAGLQAAEAGCRRRTFRLQIFPALAERYVDVRGDAFRDIDIEVDLLRAVRACGRTGECWQRHLVGDKGVVGQDRRRKEPVAGKAVRAGIARMEQYRRYSA
jgi:hypothetical protein